MNTFQLNDTVAYRQPDTHNFLPHFNELTDDLTPPEVRTGEVNGTIIGSPGSNRRFPGSYVVQFENQPDAVPVLGCLLKLVHRSEEPSGPIAA